MLIPLFLYEKQILSQPMFYLSEYLETNRSEYVAKLRALSDHDNAWGDWITFFLTALIEQAKKNATVARAIMDLYENLKQTVIKLTRSSFAVPLLDAFFVRPILRSSELTSRSDMPSKPVTMNMINRLKEANILKVLQEGSGRRPQVIALVQLINLYEGRKIIRI
jgi:Fic family protein